MPKTKSHNTKPAAAELAERMKAEILFDIQQGVVPSSVRSYSELHDYVDANGYGGLFADEMPYDLSLDADMDTINAAQQIVDRWLSNGRT